MHVCVPQACLLLSEVTGSCRKQVKSWGPLGTEAQPCQGPVGVTQPSCVVRLGHGKASLWFECECWQCAETLGTAASSSRVPESKTAFLQRPPWSLASPSLCAVHNSETHGSSGYPCVILCYCCSISASAAHWVIALLCVCPFSIPGFFD